MGQGAQHSWPISHCTGQQQDQEPAGTCHVWRGHFLWRLCRACVPDHTKAGTGWCSLGTALSAELSGPRLLGLGTSPCRSGPPGHSHGGARHSSSGRSGRTRTRRIPTRLGWQQGTGRASSGGDTEQGPSLNRRGWRASTPTKNMARLHSACLTAIRGKEAGPQEKTVLRIYGGGEAKASSRSTSRNSRKPDPTRPVLQ